MKQCYDGGGKDACYQQAADSIMKKISMPQALQIFSDNETKPEIFSRCHEVTHYLSRIEYDKTQSIPTVFSECTSACHGGCYHGVMEEYFKDKSKSVYTLPEQVIIDNVKTACGMQADYAVPRVYSECIHGIGHAMMFITDQNVPYSLKLCDSLQNESDRTTCYSGVFMENSSSSTNWDHPTKYLKADDPLYPCDALGKQYQYLCYEYQSSYFAELTHWDWQKTAALCLRVPSDYQEGCFNVIGSNLVGYTQDYGVILQNCELMPADHWRQICIRGVMSALGGRYVNDVQKSAQFCALVKDSDKQICYQTIGNAVASWSVDAQKQAGWCSQLSGSDAQGWCRQAAAMPSPVIKTQ